MKYQQQITELQNEPEQLEVLYQNAVRKNEESEFKENLQECYQRQPENILYQAWYYRLRDIAVEAAANWKLGIPIALLTGFVIWLLSSENLTYDTLRRNTPYVILFWSPMVAWGVIAYLAFTSKKAYRWAGAVALGLLAFTLYIYFMSFLRPNYRQLMLIHLPLLSWITVGLFLLHLKPSKDDFFAFLNKTIEVIVTAGLYLISGWVFFGIVFLMFEALDIYLPDEVIRFAGTFGLGMIPILALISSYDPSVKPSEQDFARGLSRLIATVPRVLLVISIPVLLIYLVLIPFNFMEPFENRDVLITYNILLFAIMGLLIGATPLDAGQLSERNQKLLRWGIILLSGLVVLVSLYAMSATIYRTVEGGITMNRLTIIGWNTINISVLVLLLVRQFCSSHEEWGSALKSTFRAASLAYILWGVFLIISVPLLFSY